MKKSEAIKLIALLQAAYPREPMPDETVKVYAEDLLDLDAEQAIAVIQRIRRTSEFFPSIAKIRCVYAEATVRAPSLDQAWAEVRRAIAAIGGYRNPTWSHPAIGAAVDAIGWQTLCHSEEIGVERAHFFKAYEQARLRMIEHANLVALAPASKPPLQLVADLAEAKALKEPA